MPRDRGRTFVGLLLVAALAGVARGGEAGPVTKVPKELRESLALDPFYQKYVSADGLPVLASAKVSDRALVEAAYLINQMLANRPDVLKALIKRKVRFVVMAPTEMTTDVPEQRNMKPKAYWDRRARGLGGRVTSCGEENLLNLKGDRYFNENILIHEFAHAIHGYALRKTDPTFDRRLREAYRAALAKGRWKDTYAATDPGEYWAEGVQSYFDCNAPAGGVHNDINTRDRLKVYDPGLFRLIDEAFKQSTFRYVRYDRRHSPKSPAVLPKYVPTAEQLRNPTRRPAGKVYKARVEPHWFDGNRRFWYRNDLRGGAREFVLVDADKGRRCPAFDHTRLAAVLAKAAAVDVKADRLPFDEIEFLDGTRAIRFRVGDTTWECDRTSYECKETAARPPRRESRAPTTSDGGNVARLEGLWPDGLAPDTERPPPPPRRPRGRSSQSPDRKWTAFVKDGNVWLRAADGKETSLSTDGKEGRAYGLLSWSPDSTTLVAFRIEPGDRKEVHLIESSPRGGGRARLRSRPYALPGDKLTAYELNLFDVAARKQTKPKVDVLDFGRPDLHWKKDGRHFIYPKTDRGHQRFRLVEVDAHTGKARTLIDERSRTFIWTAHGSGILVHYLDKTDEILYGSERDGWFHLYLLDTKAGKIKNPITRGAWRVRGVDRVDEAKRQVWFRGSGTNAGQDPYLIHHYRVNFDGSGLVALTDGDGDHRIRFSPDRKYLIDTYSRVDLPPVHELRRAADGALVYELGRADISDLKANGWQAPEVFVAKGRDGKTDIWGIISRPRHFDPAKKYPVIEYIYAGPHGSFVPKSFRPTRRFTALTDLGFIVVQIDGMGTANRSKAFHDVCWKNLKDAGFPDRIRWHQAVAQRYPYYDTNRVGIYGTSAGGQSAMGALLFHGDFYRAAVAACGCHDNRMDKASWNEQWMGYPVGQQYAASSNVNNAHRLKGKLLLVVGELDTNVPPESTLRVVDALVKAGKDFDLLVVPGMGHSDGGSYGRRRLQDFFVRHLHGVAPPDRNARDRGKP